MQRGLPPGVAVQQAQHIGADHSRGTSAHSTRPPSPRSAQVVTGKQWLLEAVGEVILRAWREASGPCAAAIEATLIQVRAPPPSGTGQGVLVTEAAPPHAAPPHPCRAAPLRNLPPPPPAASQGFARACLHASSKALAANVLTVLRQLHEAKKHSPGSNLDGALVRLYEPLLFRCRGLAVLPRRWLCRALSDATKRSAGACAPQPRAGDPSGAQHLERPPRCAALPAPPPAGPCRRPTARCGATR